MYPYRLLCSLALLFLAATTLPAQSIQKIEPPNWFTNFQNPEVELLIYGKSLRGLHVTTDYPGVHVVSTTSLENSSYLIVRLHLTEAAQPGTIPLRFYAGDRLVTTHQYPLSAKGTTTLEGFDQSDVIYLITPDRFANGDPENDVVAGLRETTVDRNNPGGRHGGDLKGIIDHISYLDELGVTALWLNPTLENDMAEYSYHGYSTTDSYRTDPRFGTNEQYQDLSRRLRQRGMKLIMDIIPNHLGFNHPFATNPPTKDWINLGNKFKPTNHRRTTVQDPYAAPADAELHTDGWFVQVMPDLNQRQAHLATYLTQHALWWIEYAQLGGLRVDTWPYSDKDFLVDWTGAILREYPEMSIVGEEWSPQPAIISYWQAGKDNHDGYASKLPSLMDFPLQMAVQAGLSEEETWGTGLIKIYETLALDFLYANPHDLVVFPDNHDMDRIFTQVDEDVALWRAALVYHLTTRGIPQLYYGTEILMQNTDYPGDHGVIRTDFPGGWAGDATNGFTGAGLSAEIREQQDWLRQLLNWRKTASTIHHGQLMHFAPQHDGAYVYFRYTDTEKYMIVLNKAENQMLDLSRYADMLTEATQLKDVLSGAEYPINSELPIPSRGGFIYQVK
ncbi:glycoside hydrolase family 13 protein [Lewinella sp. 4G2]|uniref:glycoside hydrolase family 13 protein n=1 Tax=Lewinella sp. 4G2 TaxID=1803372 RepID=UPI0007B45E83|nr:glycoside hydrolase family 13 protein [Lewinella sp. 4G2]OAV43703.1 alpha-amlyase [Lewinella sp. 4G2]